MGSVVCSQCGRVRWDGAIPCPGCGAGAGDALGLKTGIVNARPRLRRRQFMDTFGREVGNQAERPPVTSGRRLGIAAALGIAGAVVIFVLAYSLLAGSTTANILVQQGGTTAVPE